MRRAAAGDKSAFAAIVREHQSLVFSVAYHFLRNAALAEDIAQEIFFDLYRSLRTIESPLHLVAWLRRTTINRCIDQSRSRAYRNEMQLGTFLELACTDRTPDPIAGDMLRRQVAALSESHRAVVILRYGENLEPQEIAKLLNIPLNTVKSRLHRALQTLRTKLERKRRQTA